MTLKRVADYQTLTTKMESHLGRDWDAYVKTATKSKKRGAPLLALWNGLWEGMQATTEMYIVSVTTEHDDFKRDENGDMLLSEATHQRALCCQCKQDRAQGHCSHKLMVAASLLTADC